MFDGMCVLMQNVDYGDNDTYQCYTCNKFGCDSSSGLLSVIGQSPSVNAQLMLCVYFCLVIIMLDGCNIFDCCVTTGLHSALHLRNKAFFTVHRKHLKLVIACLAMVKRVNKFWTVPVFTNFDTVHRWGYFLSSVNFCYSFYTVREQSFSFCLVLIHKKY